MATVKIRKADVSDHELTDDDLAMTIGCFVDTFSHHLATYEEILEHNGITTRIRPYEDQVDELMYRIPVFQPTPPFVIHKSRMLDEMKKIYDEFKSFSHPHEFEQALLDAVGHLFENRNSVYYHRSVKQLLWVKVVW